MLKVVTIVGTRPELIKLACVIAALDEAFDHTLIHTGQNYDYELNEVFFQQLNIRKPDHFLDVAGGSAADTIANVIAKGDAVLRDLAPDAVLVLGDTNSCLVTIAAKKLHIPIFHMEAGNRCFDQRVPEEVNRKIIDHISDINLTYTEHARRYLLAEGLPADQTMKTGSPMYEVLKKFEESVNASSVLTELELERKKYFVVSAHREENVDEPSKLEKLVASVNSIAEEYDCPVIFSVHPRTRARIDKIDALHVDPRLKLLPPFGFFEYIHLQMNALCVMSDSGTITEESSILGFPAVTLREAHERPEGMDEGVLIMTGLEPANVKMCVRLAIDQHVERPPFEGVVVDYVAPNVSGQIVKIIASYTSFVNQKVWRRY